MNEYLSNGRLWRLCQKELRESLRDRRTLFTLVLMPILVYPLLSMALQRLVIGANSKTKEVTEYVLGVEDEEAGGKIRELLIEAQQTLERGFASPITVTRSNDPTEKDTTSSPVKPSDEIPSYKIEMADRATLDQALSDGRLDLLITKLNIETTKLERGVFPAYTIQAEFRQNDLRSETALSGFRRATQLINDYQAALFRKQIDRKIPVAMTFNATGIFEKADLSSSIAGVIPLVLILMTITGAVYPAIDLTAGERERGTMEALIATPAPRFALLLSKYVAVVTVAVLTALANLFATWMTLSFGGLGQALFGKSGFSVLMLLQILPLLVIFACFFSAILLALCSFARSFKEAQAYLIPVMLLSLGPGLVTLMPNVQFTTLLGIVPLLNILMLSRDIMTGQSSLVPAFAAVFSTIIYACATLVVASRLFGAEAATSGSQESWSELLSRPKKKQMLPDIGELAIYLALLFPVFFVASNLGGMFEWKGSWALFLNAAILFVLFMLLPLLYSWYRRIDLANTFRLSEGVGRGEPIWNRIARWIGYVAGVLLLSAALWMVAFEAYLLFESWSLASQLSEEDKERLKSDFLVVPFWVVLLTGAVAPAIAEEFFFRGFVLSAFRSKLTAFRSVLFTSLLFGLFHVIAGSVLSIEKFLPTIILGMAIGYVAVRTGSLFPGILLHALHNGLVFSMSRFTEQDLARWFGEETKHIPVVWLCGGVLSMALGAGVLFLSSQRNQSHEDSN
ncbi:MAG: ABC transporter permease subunit [Planctomycetota bacterium]|nr:ABC transporter permease subunit [Planctomycetota bacterium]